MTVAEEEAASMYFSGSCSEKMGKTMKRIIFVNDQWTETKNLNYSRRDVPSLKEILQLVNTSTRLYVCMYVLCVCMYICMYYVCVYVGIMYLCPIIWERHAV
jgi:hypothetical protein